MDDRPGKRARKSHIWERDPLDWYVEGQDCTAALLSVETFTSPIWDPSCGMGNTVRAARAAGYLAVGTDLVDRGAPHLVGLNDFTASNWTPFAPGVGFSMIVNPPYFRARGTEAFIRHALQLPGLLKLAVFADLGFVAGDDRAAGLYVEHPPTRVLVVTPRPSCPPGAALLAGVKPEGGTPNFCWLVWEAPYLAPGSQATTMGWARREVAPR